MDRPTTAERYLDELEERKPHTLYVRWFWDALANPTSLQTAITVKCMQCESAYDDTGGAERIRTCNVRSCTLWPHRPYRGDVVLEGEGAEPADANALEVAEEPAQATAEQTAQRFDPIRKAHERPTSRRLAVNGKCWDCMGGGRNVSTQGLIRDCPVVLCPTHHVRPYQNLGKSPGDQSGEAGAHGIPPGSTF